MTDRFTEPGKAAVISPLNALSPVYRQATEPASRLALDLPEKAISIQNHPVSHPPPPVVTDKDIAQWLRDAITQYQISVQTALDRATSIIKSAKEPNLNSLLGNIFDIGGALLSPLAPWVGGLSATIAVALKDVIDEAPSTIDIENFRLSILKGAKQVSDIFLENIETNISSLLQSTIALNMTKNEAHENTLLNVLTANSVSKSTAGIVGIDFISMTSEIELKMLLEFAAAGEDVVIRERYDINHIKDGDGNIKPPNQWTYTRRSVSIDSSIPTFKPRLLSLLKVLNDQPLKLSHLRITLKVNFGSGSLFAPGVNIIPFRTHTALWQKPYVENSIEFGTLVHDGPISASNDSGDAIHYLSSLPPGIPDDIQNVINRYAENRSRYRFLDNYTRPEVIGLILCYEAWKGSFPDIQRSNI